MYFNSPTDYKPAAQFLTVVQGDLQDAHTPSQRVLSGIHPNTMRVLITRPYITKHGIQVNMVKTYQVMLKI
jgi:hypothetical protein